MIHRLTLGAMAIVLAAAAPVRAPVSAPVSAPSASPAAGKVALSAKPGTEVDATARRLAAADLQDDPHALVLIGSERLGRFGTGPALFVQLQSNRACGSAGCSTSVFLPTKTGWVKILDAVNGPLSVEPGEHGGMHDLHAGKSDRFVWTGRVYADTQPAPQVDLRPRKPKRGHHLR